ncbi:MAG: hypothetical protein A2498_12765 [Lentisphaerae bacterium RIFOXYC12_FULL_60_16]|nr:MAG: hypothetical protein A2498_12765 [Lentisphaerae bacterium RIFOXYC12_FULL_60_16]OGV71187.1 MAG: hypothetical protein A2269_03495 [Lentisphaerae bacterium RIFOXYA12_FULL_60_10]OGV83929.1 MAG: hypothetical protein A2340_11755 [Lentisphaerae bacterium RIFOXYB12_FULL_60_10]
MIPERIRSKLANGQPALGISIRYPDPSPMELIAPAWDFIWIDLQHGTCSPAQVPDLVRVCDTTGTASLVRFPAQHDPNLATWILDWDASGIVSAQVDNVETARQLVQHVKFPPLGNRSFGGRRIIDRHGRDYVTRANREQWLIVQIESPEGLDQCEAIAAIDGIDGLMIGPDDLRLRLFGSVAGPVYDTAMRPIHERITRAARAAGKLAMGFGGPAPETFQTAVSLGYQLISVTADVLLLKERQQQILDTLKPVLPASR